MKTIDMLVAEDACRTLVQTGADAVDAGDAAGFAALFTPDGVLVRPDGSQLQGPTAIAQAYAARDPDRLTQHLLCNHQVEVDIAQGRAVSRCKVLLWSGRHSAVPGKQGRPAEGPVQVGAFLDTLRQTPDGWRIHNRHAHFILYRDG